MNAPAFAPLVLFDLDGTLVDSSGDLTAAANQLRADLDLEPIPAAQVRNAISGGTLAILAASFPELSEDQREPLAEAYIEAYRDQIGRNNVLFDGIEQVLETLEAAGVRWGIVSNKRESLAQLVIERMGLSSRCAVLIGGDTTPRSKPDPLPVLTACERLGVDPQAAVFVGDDLRDVQAGRAAGCSTVAVAWGFQPADTDYESYGADWVALAPHELLLPGVLASRE